jgi:hypothetical protein
MTMVTHQKYKRGIGAAVLAAGPVFVVATALAGLYLQLPSPVVVTAQGLWMTAAILVPATAVGAIISLPVVAIGTAAMAGLSRAFPLARTRLAWPGRWRARRRDGSLRNGSSRNPASSPSA